VSPSTFVTSFPFLASTRGDGTAISEKFVRLTQKLRPGVPAVSSGLCTNVASPKLQCRKRTMASSPTETTESMCCDRTDDKENINTLSAPGSFEEGQDGEGRNPYEMVFKVNLVGAPRSSSSSSGNDREDRRHPNKKKKRNSRTKDPRQLVTHQDCEEESIFLCEPPSTEPQRSLSLVAEIMSAEVKADPGRTSVVVSAQQGMSGLDSELLLQQQRWLHAAINIGDLSPIAGDMSEGSPSFMFLKSEPMALKMEERLARNPYFIRTPPQLRRTEPGIAASMTYDCMEEDDVWF